MGMIIIYHYQLLFVIRSRTINEELVLFYLYTILHSNIYIYIYIYIIEYYIPI